MPGPLTRTLLFTVVAPGTVALLVPWLAVSTLGAGDSPSLLRLLGLALIAAGIMLYLWSALGFSLVGQGTPAPWDPPRRFVAVGPYRFVRNPMYVGVLTAIAGWWCLTLVPALLAYLGAAALAVHTFVIVHEEPSLRNRFGSEYEEYLRQVPRWLPRLG